MPVLGAEAALVDLQQRRIHDAVGERLIAQGGEPPGPSDDAPSSGQMIEIIDDHAGIVEHIAVLQDERRDLSQRVLLADRIRRIQRIRIDDLNAIGGPRIEAVSLTFRPKGDAGEERRTSMSKLLSRRTGALMNAAGRERQSVLSRGPNASQR